MRNGRPCLRLGASEHIDLLLLAARQQKSAFENAVAEGQGAISVDGVMVDAASIRLVQNLLDRAELYGL